MSVIIAPIITEKSMQLLPEGRYTLHVSPNANKIEIAKEIEKRYKVSVVSVNIINIKGKVKLSPRTRIKGRRSDVKKAIITLKKGDKLPGFEVGSEDQDKKVKK